jgi:hypothetical protein
MIIIIFRDEGDFQGLSGRIKLFFWYCFLGKAGRQCHYIFSNWCNNSLK